MKEDNKAYIGYFDYLGFKEFIQKNTLEEQKGALGKSLLVHLENALSNGKVNKLPDGSFQAQLANVIINVTNFSDTVIFWTYDDLALEHFIRACYEFNWRNNLFCFPVRGCLAYGELFSIDHRSTTEAGGSYNINSVYGAGIVLAHDKAEALQWAGTVIDNTFISRVDELGLNLVELLGERAKVYSIPYNPNKHSSLEEGYALKLLSGNVDEQYVERMSENVTRAFTSFNKSISDSVTPKLENTKQFLRSHIDS